MTDKFVPYSDAAEIARAADIEECHWRNFHKVLRKAVDECDTEHAVALTMAMAREPGTPLDRSEFIRLRKSFAGTLREWQHTTRPAREHMLLQVGEDYRPKHPSSIEAALRRWIAACDEHIELYRGAKGVSSRAKAELRPVYLMLGSFWLSIGHRAWAPQFPSNVARGNAAALFLQTAIYCGRKAGRVPDYSAHDCYIVREYFRKLGKRRKRAKSADTN